VVEDPIEHDSDVSFVRLVDQRPQSLVSPEERVDREVVVCVIAVVRGRLKDWTEVDRSDAESLQIVKVLDYPKQISTFEPVDSRRRVPRLEVGRLRYLRTDGEAIRKDLLEDRVVDPLGRCER
jgi:hypothetical protein